MTTKPTVYAGWIYTGTTYYAAPAGTVQGISWNVGRQNITDQWYGGSCTVYGRSPSSLAQAPQIGQIAKVGMDASGTSYGYVYFYGYVSDYRIIYGITPAYDTWELTLETSWGIAGRKTGTVSVTAGQSTGAIVDGVATLLPTQIKNGGTEWWSTTVSAQTFTGQLANALTTAMVTDAGFLVEYVADDGRTPQTTIFGNKRWGMISNDPFTDVPSDLSTYGRYGEIEFHSAAYNYGTKVTVQASGLADQSVGTGDYVQTFTTVNETTTQAANLAGYYQAKFQLATAVPYSITFTGAQQTYELQYFNLTPQLVGSNLPVKFRGTTYYCLIEGISMSANATDWRATYYLSAATQSAFLRLNSPVLGTLDNNRLGF